MALEQQECARRCRQRGDFMEDVLDDEEMPEVEMPMSEAVYKHDSLPRATHGCGQRQRQRSASAVSLSLSPQPRLSSWPVNHASSKAASASASVTGAEHDWPRHT